MALSFWFWSRRSDRMSRSYSPRAAYDGRSFLLPLVAMTTLVPLWATQALGQCPTTPQTMLSWMQNHAQTHPVGQQEWSQCQQQDGVACFRFTWSVVETINQNCDTQCWGLLSKQGGEWQCTPTECGNHLNGTGYSEDAIVWRANQDPETVYDIIGNAGGPNPQIQMLEVDRRPNNRWICPWEGQGVPGAPTIIKPTQNQTIHTNIAFIEWTGDPQIRFQARVNSVNSPDSGIVWESSVMTSNQRFTWTGPLSNGSTYHAFVRLGNANEFGPWSSGRTFTINTAQQPPGPNIVQLQGNSLVDNNGPFNGLGASYFQAMRRCKFDRPRFESDLAFLASKDFKYIRILSMVGWYAAWQGKEIAPVSFNNQNGVFVPAWPDYWQQFRDCIDIAYDNYGIRSEITIFADAQLMPNKNDRINHMQMVLDNLVGREHKVMHLEVANEAWQNGFPGSQGIADLREFCQYLTDRTNLLVAISDSQGEGSATLQLYTGSTARLVTEHFSRNIGTVEGGWLPVRDPWHAEGLRTAGNLPPFSSNEPIGPGSSVNTENDPIKLVMAAAFAWGANLPLYVFHSEAGVFGNSTFQSLQGVGDYVHLDNIIPPDIASWVRNDGKESMAAFTSFANGQADRWWTEVSNPTSGAVRNTGKIKGAEFLTFPIGILGGGLQLQARRPMSFQVYNPLTGAVVSTQTRGAGEQFTLAQGPGAYIIKGIFTDMIGPSTDEVWIDLGSPDVAFGMTHPQNSDGDTTPATIGGRTARRNVNPNEDFYFYFGVNDAFAFEGSRPELFIIMDYYDTGSGSLSLQYDSIGTGLGAMYKAGGSVPLTGTNTWKKKTFQVTDAYFGNRQNGGADFRIAGPFGTVFYLDRLEVTIHQPLPPVISEVSPDPELVRRNVPYTRQLTLTQGYPPPNWTVIQAPAGTQVSSTGLVSGWTPVSSDLGPVPFTVQASNVEGMHQRSWTVWVLSSADLDGDGDVDVDDFAIMQRCFSGEAVPHPPGCSLADLDGDGDVDGSDFNLFFPCLQGANLMPGC